MQFLSFSFNEQTCTENSQRARGLRIDLLSEGGACKIWSTIGEYGLVSFSEARNQNLAGCQAFPNVQDAHGVRGVFAHSPFPVRGEHVPHSTLGFEGPFSFFVTKAMCP